MANATATRDGLVWLAPLLTLALGYAIGHARRDADLATTLTVATAAPLSSRASSATNAAPAFASKLATNGQPLPDLPAEGIPLSHGFDALAQRARAGDSNAALRLLRETSRCWDRARQAEFLNAPDIASSANGGAAPELKARWARMREAARASLEASAKDCADVTTEQIASTGEWLQRAAASGDPGAKFCYVWAGDNDDFAPPRFSDAWIDWMRQYREQARTDAEQAFAAGIPQAAAYLYDANAGRYSMSHDLTDAAATADYAKAYALALFQTQRLETSPDTPDDEPVWRIRARVIAPELSDTEIAWAQQWADAASAKMARQPAPSLPCYGVPAE